MTREPSLHAANHATSMYPREYRLRARIDNLIDERDELRQQLATERQRYKQMRVRLSDRASKARAQARLWRTRALR